MNYFFSSWINNGYHTEQKKKNNNKSGSYMCTKVPSLWLWNYAKRMLSPDAKAFMGSKHRLDAAAYLRFQNLILGNPYGHFYYEDMSTHHYYGSRARKVLAHHKKQIDLARY